VRAVLQGVRVLEQGTFITGPAAGMLLADLGAEVIKVEQPGAGDPFRGRAEDGLYSPQFQTYNRNKQSIALDTRDARDRGVFDRLVERADVYIQNFRPGVAERLHADAARLRGLNPRLVYASISGFGTDGPDAERPCFDTVAQAASGFLQLMVNPANQRVTGPALADAMTGHYAAQGILAALFERSRTGIGCTVEVSMLEAMCHFNLDAYTHHAVGERLQPYSRPSASQAFVLRCRDERWVALHLSTPDKFWAALVDAVGQPGRFEAAGFGSRAARVERADELIVLLQEIFVQHDLATWCTRLRDMDVPHAPMYDASEALADPQARHLQIGVTMAHPTRGTVTTVRSPFAFDGARALAVRAPPLLDEHHAEILGMLDRLAPTGDER